MYATEVLRLRTRQILPDPDRQSRKRATAIPLRYADMPVSIFGFAPVVGGYN